MSKTIRKDIIRLIRTTKGRFFSLTAIVTIGVAFFVGVSASSTVMADNVDVYSDRLNLKDITVYSGFGFDDDDIKALAACEDVEHAEGSKFVDVMASSGPSTVITRIHSYDPESVINRFDLREGRLPRNIREVLSEAGTDMEPGYQVGTRIRLSRPENDLSDWLKVDTVTVVGTIDTPLYLNETKENSTLNNQYLQTYLYIPEAAFEIDYDLEANVLIKDAKPYESFYQAYEDYSAEVKEEIETLALSQQSRRRDKVLKEAREKLADGWQEYEDGKKEFEEKIADAEKEIADAEKEIADGEKELNDGIRKLRDGQKELDEQAEEARRKIEEGWAQLESGRDKLKAGEEEFREKQKEYNELKKKIRDGIRQIDDGISQLKAAQDGYRQINDGIAQIDEGISSLSQAQEGLEQIDTALQAIEDALPAARAADERLAETGGGLEDLLDNSELAQTSLSDLPESEELTQLISELGLSPDATVEDLIKAIEKEVPADRIPSLSEEELAAWKERLRIAAEALDLPEEEKQDLISEADDAIDLISEYSGAFSQFLDEDDFQQIRDEGFEAVLNEKKQMLLVQKQQILDMLETNGVDPDHIPEKIEELKKQREELETAKAEIEKGLSEQGISINEIDLKIAELEAQKKELQDNIDKINAGLADGKKQLEEAAEEIRNAYNLLKDSELELEKQLAEAQKEIDDGWKEIEKNRIKLADGKKDLEDGKKELEEAREDGLQELADAKSELDKAEQDIRELEEGKWTVLDRSQHYASRTYKNTVEQMAAIARVFPVFFAMVAALVCLTTMTRMIDEQRGQLGIMRALGYTRLKCAAKYLIYAASATLIGEVLGTVFGLLVFPFIIYTAWRMMYVLPPMRIFIPWRLIFICCVMFLAVMLGTTWYACRQDMKDVPSQLLRPKAPKLGKNTLLERLPVIWKRLTFTWKVTMRNLIRYKRRLVMTVIGVAGCTALLITGFGIRDSINSMVDTQFDEIQLYQGTLVTKGLRPSEIRHFAEETERREDIDRVTVAGTYTAIGTAPGGTLEETISVIVFDTVPDIERCYDLRTRVGHKPIVLDNSGVIINEKMAENLGLGPGDTLLVESHTGVKKEVRIASVCELYIQHYMFMSKAYYADVFGQSLAMNTLLVRVSGDDEVSRAFQREITADERVEELHFYDSILENFRTMVASLDLIVWVIILSSMSLAFVVLGNLMNINISERQREIATLKVLGFRKKEVENYIYKENNVLTVLGAVAGIPVGQLLHHFIMRQVEMDYVMFGRSVALMSDVLAVFMTIGFGLLVNMFMRGKLARIEMVESLKSVE